MAEVAEKNAARTQAVLDGTSDKLVKNQETAEVVGASALDNHISSPVVYGLCGLLLGIVITCIFFMIKIKQIKKEYDIRLNEARISLDRMLKITVKE